MMRMRGLVFTFGVWLGAGFFAMASRNKQSLAVDVKDPRGREIVLKLVAGADVFSENFKDGVMERLGFGRAALKTLLRPGCAGARVPKTMAQESS